MVSIFVGTPVTFFVGNANSPADLTLTISMFPSGILTAPPEIVTSPPTSRIAFPALTLSRLPTVEIFPCSRFKNPKALGGSLESSAASVLVESNRPPTPKTM